MREFVREVLADGNLGKTVCRGVVIAVDEACTSVILNARDTGAQGNLKILVDIDPTRIKIEIADTGNDYDVGEVTRDELIKEFTRTRKNEMGIFLIRKVMDEFTYQFKKGFQSELTMIMFLYDEPETKN